ncbi:MAG TPA: NADH-quinone oxidoreductase subunit J [Solirubrobacteraceae bacterium]|nr:NADH-quinone oxidoreductase subunit J [Solirubrobacteraceae bacterium]
MSAVLFFIAAIGVITGATGVVVLRNPFFAVLALVGHLVSLAVLFLLLRAEFVAAVQVVVYAGAVMVLYVFVVAYVGGEGETIGERLHAGGEGETFGERRPAGGARGNSGMRLGGAIFGGALLVELLIALLGTGLEATSGYGAGYVPGPQAYGTPAYIGKLLLTRFLLAFELASFLLLIAAVGGVVLARRRGGIDELSGREALAPLDLLRPRGTGTTAEAVGSAAFHDGGSRYGA